MIARAEVLLNCGSRHKNDVHYSTTYCCGDETTPTIPSPTAVLPSHQGDAHRSTTVRSIPLREFQSSDSCSTYVYTRLFLSVQKGCICGAATAFNMRSPLRPSFSILRAGLINDVTCKHTSWVDNRSSDGIICTKHHNSGDRLYPQEPTRSSADCEAIPGRVQYTPSPG